MKRGNLLGKLVFWIVALFAVFLFLWVTLGNLGDIVEPSTQLGCPIDQKIIHECPCQGQRIAGGYCCEDGPSDEPCS
jgi:hypothetical protein